MNATRSPRRPARQANGRRRAGRILLAAAGLATALLASACDTAQQVPWATYSSQLQPRIDAATATRGCAALQAFLTAAKTTSTAHEKATGFPNDALVAYIQTSQHQAGCPTKIGLPATAAVHTKLILTTLSLGSAADRQVCPSRREPDGWSPSGADPAGPDW